jgi:hypothetical protein
MKKKKKRKREGILSTVRPLPPQTPLPPI